MANKKISELDPAGAIVGTELVELVQSGASVRSTVDGIKNGGVKVYRALLTQSGTNHPSADVLENSIGEIDWTRVDTGSYLGTLNGAFPASKVWLSPFNITLGNSALFSFFRDSNNALAIVSSDDGNLSGQPIEIRVYP